MKPVRIRIIAAHEVSDEQVNAVKRGLNFFVNQGIRVETAHIEEPSAFADVKNGPFIRGVLNGPEEKEIPACIPWYIQAMSLARGNSVLGLGIKARRILSQNGYAVLGICEFLEGGVISTASISTLPKELSAKALELIARHEAGHLFRPNEHCENKMCVMQENKTKEDFLGTHVARELDFCTACAATISQIIAQMQMPVYA